MDSPLLVTQTLAAFLFCMGLFMVLYRKNTMIMLMAIELMLNSANLSLVSFSHHYGLLEGQVQVFFVITLAAAESAIGISLLLNLYRNLGSVYTDKLSHLKG